MHQRHPIRVDKSRALPAGSDRQMSGSNQVSFHKIYRQKRCYSMFDKGKEGHSSSQWRSECANTLRDSNIALESRYSVGSSGFKTTRKVEFKETIKSGSPSSSFLSDRDFPKSDRDFPKRSFNRFSCNFASVEFDAPVVKKQKVESYKPSAPQHFVSQDFDHSMQKSSFDDTKWMYKNQHAKMSGPYGVKQLMEGLQARFLQEDLPIYQLQEGKLCKPISLKQLMDDLQWSTCDSGRRHFNQGMPSQPEESAGQVADDIDLPPGFGGRSSQFPGKSCRDYSPSSTVSIAGSRCAARGISSVGSEFGDTDFCLPPGFEGGAATESQTSELCGSPRRLSMAAWREKVQPMHSSYEQLEPMVHDRVHSSWIGNPPHSLVSFPQQGTKAGTEIFSNGHPTWAYAPAASKLPSYESQTFSQPTVCIGLPVSKQVTQSWPIASTLPSGVYKAEPYGYFDASVLPNNTSTTLGPVRIPQMHGLDPLTLIFSELLAAVKRTYVNSVLSALIGEQLDCWLAANKSWTGSSSPPDKDSFARGACRQLLRTEVNMGNAEASASFVEACSSPEASTLHMEASTTTTTGHPDVVSQGRDAQFSEGSLVSHTASLGKSQNRSLTETRNDACAFPPIVMADTLVASNIEDNGIGSSKVSPSSGKSEESSLLPESIESCLSINEAGKSFPKSSSSPGSEPNQTLSVFKEENPHQLGEEIPNDDGRVQASGNTSNAVLLEAELLPLATRSKKGNVKSLKQLMLITSKLRSRQTKNSLAKKSGSKLTCDKSSEVLETRQRTGIPQGYNGCARTSVCGSAWVNRAQLDGHHMESGQNEGHRSKTGEIGVSTRMQTRAQSAQSRSAHVETLNAASEVSDAVKLTLSKVRKRKLKVARSKIHKWGVFSVESVEVGDFVSEYIGELVRPRIADIREEHYAKLGVESGYVFRIDNDCVVDATKRGGLARFINHSCDPNCYIKIATVEGSKRFLIFAKRQIQAGEEVTFNYKSLHGVLNFQCRCGSSECQGSAM